MHFFLFITAHLSKNTLWIVKLVLECFKFDVLDVHMYEVGVKVNIKEFYYNFFRSTYVRNLFWFIFNLFANIQTHCSFLLTIAVLSSNELFYYFGLEVFEMVVDFSKYVYSIKISKLNMVLVHSTIDAYIVFS